MSWFGRMIALTTLVGTVFDPKKSRRCASAGHWFSGPRLQEAVQSIVLGQTGAGRYLFCVVIQLPGGKGFPVTARSMTQKERRRYNRWKDR